MPNDEKQSTDGVKCNYCGSDGKCKCCYGGRCWLWVIGAIVLLAVIFKIGWYSSMKYYGATWDTPRGALMQENTESGN